MYYNYPYTALIGNTKERVFVEIIEKVIKLITKILLRTDNNCKGTPVPLRFINIAIQHLKNLENPLGLNETLRLFTIIATEVWQIIYEVIQMLHNVKLYSAEYYIERSKSS